MVDRARVEAALEKVRQGLRAEGGDLELVEIRDAVVYVRLTGACGSCPMSGLTMKSWVEETMKKEIPGIRAVQAV